MIPRAIASNVAVCAVIAISTVPFFRTELFSVAKQTFLAYGKHAGGVSIELSDAPPERSALERTAAWLSVHRKTIIWEERRFQVDRRIIGAAVAYEALEDVAPFYLPDLARWSGPGKVHYKEFRLLEGDPVSKQVEEMGLLPPRSMSTRENILSTPDGALSYIAAIMHGYDQRMHDRGNNDSLKCNMHALLALYTSVDFKKLPAPTALDVFAQNSPVDGWIDRHEFWLKDILGSPPARFCTGVVLQP